MFVCFCLYLFPYYRIIVLLPQCGISDWSLPLNMWRLETNANPCTLVIRRETPWSVIYNKSPERDVEAYILHFTDTFNNFQRRQAIPELKIIWLLLLHPSLDSHGITRLLIYFIEIELMINSHTYYITPNRKIAS